MRRGVERSGVVFLAAVFSLMSGASYFHHHGAFPILPFSSAQSVIHPDDDGPERCAVCGASHVGARLQDRADAPDAGGAVLSARRDADRSAPLTAPRSPGSPRSPPLVPRAA